MPAAPGQTARPTTYASRTGSLAQATDNAFSYDASGNLLTTASFVFAYDALGRLSSAIRTASTPGGYRQPIDTQRYRYGADSQRLEKRHNGSATRYLYHGMDVIAEVSVTLSANTTLPGTSSAAVNSAQLKKTYHWRPTGIGRAGRLLQITDHTANRAALAGYDGRGNLTTWTDAATGALLGGRDYSAYGTAQLEIWYDTDAKELFGKTGFSYSTEYLDETGLIYFGFRYYSPEHGRFISRDPLGETGSGANLYAFANNDPVNYRELYGLCPTEGGGTGGRSPEDEVEELEPFIVKPPTYGDWEEFYSEWIDESTYCTTYERTVTEYDSTGEISAEYSQYRTVCEYYRGTNEDMDDWYGDGGTGQEPEPEEEKRKKNDCHEFVDRLIAIASEVKGFAFDEMVTGMAIISEYTPTSSDVNELFAEFRDIYPSVVDDLNHPTKIGELREVSGFRPELVRGDQNAGVYLHISANAGLYLQGFLASGAVFQSAIDFYENLTGVHEHAQFKAELEGNFRGVEVGKALEAFLDDEKGENATRDRLRSLLCI